MSSIITERFKELVTSSGKTRQEIAEQIGCDASTVTKHFGGSRAITSDFLVKYAEYFGVSTDYLVGLTDAKTNDKSKEVYVTDEKDGGMSITFSTKPMEAKLEEAKKALEKQLPKKPVQVYRYNFKTGEDKLSKREVNCGECALFLQYLTEKSVKSYMCRIHIWLRLKSLVFTKRLKRPCKCSTSLKSRVNTEVAYSKWIRC